MSSAIATRRLLICALIGSVSAFHPSTAGHAQIGTVVPDLEMAKLDGGSARLLANAEASVLMFFRPNQEHSRETLREMAACRKPFAGASVRWVAIVSSTAPAEDAAAVVRDSGLEAPILVDRDDSLYGSLGVVLHPVVVIVGRDRRLAAFEPFRSVNLCAIVTARIRRVLGEISDADVQRVLAPPKAVNGGDAVTARRNLKLAEALFKGGNNDKALESVRRSLEMDHSLAPAYVLLGEILVTQGNCADATQAFRSALQIDSTIAGARKGIERCTAAR